MGRRTSRRTVLRARTPGRLVLRRIRSRRVTVSPPIRRRIARLPRRTTVSATVGWRITRLPRRASIVAHSAVVARGPYRSTGAGHRCRGTAPRRLHGRTCVGALCHRLTGSRTEVGGWSWYRALGRCRRECVAGLRLAVHLWTTADVARCRAASHAPLGWTRNVPHRLRRDVACGSSLAGYRTRQVPNARTRHIARAIRRHRGVRSASRTVRRDPRRRSSFGPTGKGLLIVEATLLISAASEGRRGRCARHGRPHSRTRRRNRRCTSCAGSQDRSPRWRDIHATHGRVG